MKLIIYLLFLFSDFSNAAMLSCKFGNLFLSGNEINSRMVIDTYMQLLHEVGGGQVSPKMMKAIFQSGDPFTLPKEETLSSQTLQKSLEEFRDMLRIHAGKEGVPFKDELLEAIKGYAGEVSSQVNAQKKIDNKELALPLLQLDWKNHISTIHNFGDWYFGAEEGRHAKVHFQNGKEKITLNYNGAANYSIGANTINPLNGELLFTDSNSTNLYKMQLFNADGKPLKESRMNLLGSDNSYPFKSIDNIEISKDGKYVVVVDSAEGAFVAETKGAATLLNFKKIGKTDRFTRRIENYGFIGNSHYFLNHEMHLTFHDLEFKEEPDRFNLRNDIWKFSPSEDGNTLLGLNVMWSSSPGIVLNSNLGSKPRLTVLDLHDKKNKKINIIDLGHKDPIDRKDGNYHDDAISIPELPYFAQLFLGRKTERGKNQIRMLDKEGVSSLDYIMPFNMEEGEKVQRFDVSADHQTLFLHTLQKNSSYGTATPRTRLWDLKIFRERLK